MEEPRHERYLRVYKTFLVDIVTLKSFPLFILYLICATNCYKWKKIAGPIDFRKVWIYFDFDSFFILI